MAGRADEMKGRAREAAGDLTGNKDLKSEGKADRQAGQAKKQLGAIEAKGERAIDTVTNILRPKK
jgi:uncharacterized protein YjbJ (UPF0337 family)